jgi:hypothetical protein
MLGLRRRGVSSRVSSEVSKGVVRRSVARAAVIGLCARRRLCRSLRGSRSWLQSRPTRRLCRGHPTENRGQPPRFGLNTGFLATRGGALRVRKSALGLESEQGVNSTRCVPAPPACARPRPTTALASGSRPVGPLRSPGLDTSRRPAPPQSDGHESAEEPGATQATAAASARPGRLHRPPFRRVPPREPPPDLIRRGVSDRQDGRQLAARARQLRVHRTRPRL